eukprot:9462754-Ditylum_brightwellii.AAC.1
MNIDETMYNKGYAIDEEEALPSKKELAALVAYAENPVHNNTNITCCVVDDNINSDFTAGDPGSSVLISDKNIDQMRQAMLDRVVIIDENTALTNAATSSNKILGFPEGVYWEDLLPQSASVEEPTNAFQGCAPTVPEEDH